MFLAMRLLFTEDINSSVPRLSRKSSDCLRREYGGQFKPKSGFRSSSLYKIQTVVHMQARKRNTKIIFMRAGPAFFIGTVALWRVVNAGVSS